MATEGYNDWIHLGSRLKEHETSADHVLNMTTWYELRSRLQSDQAIEKLLSDNLRKKKTTGEKYYSELFALLNFLPSTV